MANTLQLSAEQERNLKIRDLISNPGMVILKEEIENIAQGANSHVEQYLYERINQDKLADLNFKIGFRRGVEAVKEVIADFEEASV